jgi:hypothetical protein
MSDHSFRERPKLGRRDGDLLRGNRWLRRRHGGDVTHFAASAKPNLLSRLSGPVNGYISWLFMVGLEHTMNHLESRKVSLAFCCDW